MRSIKIKKNDGLGERKPSLARTVMAMEPIRLGKKGPLHDREKKGNPQSRQVGYERWLRASDLLQARVTDVRKASHPSVQGELGKKLFARIFRAYFG